MGKTESLTITLPAEVAALLHRAVEQGHYASPDQAVSEAIVQWNAGEDDVKYLRQAWEESFEDEGPSEDMEVVMDRLEAKYRKLAASKCA